MYSIYDVTKRLLNNSYNAVYTQLQHPKLHIFESFDEIYTLYNDIRNDFAIFLEIKQMNFQIYYDTIKGNMSCNAVNTSDLTRICTILRLIDQICMEKFGETVANYVLIHDYEVKDDDDEC